jgi:hypothetical protein
MDAQAMTASYFAAYQLTLAVAWLAAGTAIGGFFFLSLRWNVRMLAAGRRLLPVMAIQLARFAAIGIALATISIDFGALALLATTAGILAARALLVRWEM